MSNLAKLSGWKNFERLCADLLEAEGFAIDSEPYIDHTGVDFKAIEEYRSHDPSRSVKIPWRVQCKHLAESGKRLGRREIEECLNSYGATGGHDEGLFLMVSSDYTEPAKEAIDKFLASRQHSRVCIWNGRQIVAKLDRHPQLLARYHINNSSSEYLSTFELLRESGAGDVFFISDQSLLAHNLSAALAHAGFNVIFLPFWNYQDSLKLDILMSSINTEALRLIVCFLGDSYSLPMPPRLTQYLDSTGSYGIPLLLFPFLAWAIKKGIYRHLQPVCPARLIDPTDAGETFDSYRILGEVRRGDFRWLLRFDSFAEDQYVEYDPKTVNHPIARGINSRFGISHSFEYLRVRNGAEVVWSDTAGNPFVVTDISRGRRVCYVNSSSLMPDFRFFTRQLFRNSRSATSVTLRDISRGWQRMLRTPI